MSTVVSQLADIIFAKKSFRENLSIQSEYEGDSASFMRQIKAVSATCNKSDFDRNYRNV